MKLLTYSTNAGSKLGLLSDDGQVIDLNAASQGEIPADMLTFVQNAASYLPQVETLLKKTDLAQFSQPLADTCVSAPIQNPQKIMAIGRNYVEHSTEQNKLPPKAPMLFAIYPTAIIGPGQTITWSDELTQEVDYEGELAVIIGKAARKVSEDEALDYVFGYAIANDVTARDLQVSDKQFTRGKSLDTFCPLGPYIATADEIPDPQALSLKTSVNGETRQEDSTASMIFSVKYLISYLSQAFTLLPGDILLTGTPSGVGKYRNPPSFLGTGDEVTIEIEGLGTLSNPCKIEA